MATASARIHMGASSGLLKKQKNLLKWKPVYAILKSGRRCRKRCCAVEVEAENRLGPTTKGAPLFKKVAEGIKAQVQQVGDGQKLPSERALSEMYGTTRVTVRKAIKELIDRGVVYSEVGRGNFRASAARGETTRSKLAGSIVSVILPDLSQIYTGDYQSDCAILQIARDTRHAS